MRLVFFGDSITDMERNRSADAPEPFTYGSGYVRLVAGELKRKNPLEYEIINRGIGGNRIVDMYTRINRDVWVNSPDVLTVLDGVNDVCHPEIPSSGVELDRYENVYRRIISETLERFPECKIIILTPFLEKAWATEKQWNTLSVEIPKMAKVAEKIAAEFNLPCIPLQKKMDEAVEKYGTDVVIDDGLHPCLYGSVIIAKEWLKTFYAITGKGEQS